ncbi:MFS transporter [Streptococcus moroccensis]|uniref:GPH family glycoside/pentoside/hexuronide:cation symporter n=1 Tax=Streptococcus moroccensis TaxID=1451356 RepID=A0ABT9YUB1_9STRE|nr:glycoside-pentoside-hexuronide (GPH):cation symporter [Streptococcus moroccensis]MDQ0223573.1 GPH family glycoside/pentoside/hexuronide:cation symporter [Streptococcus moroccensis]
MSGTKIKETGYVNTREKISYSLASGGGNVVTTIIGGFLAAYLTDSVGLTAASVGTMMLLMRFADIVTDFLMGAIVERTKTRWGKARPWLLVSAILIFVALIFEFSTPGNLSMNGKLIYAYITYFFINCIGFTSFVIPHTALLSIITFNGVERQKIAAMGQIVNQILGMAVSIFWVPLTVGIGFRNTACVYAILSAIFILVGFWGTRENIYEDEGHVPIGQSKESFKASLKVIIRNKYFWIEMAVFSLLLFHNMAQGAVGYYFSNSVLNNANLVGLLSVAGMLPALFMNMIVAKLVGKFGKQKIMVLSAIVITVTSVLMGLTYINIPLLVVLTIIKGFFLGSMFSCAFALTGDVIDYGEWELGVRSEGITIAGFSLGQKLGMGLGPAVATWILAAGGYDGLVMVQTEAAKNAIVFSYTWLLAIVGVLLIILSLLLDLDKYSAQMQHELELKHRK